MEELREMKEVEPTRRSSQRQQQLLKLQLRLQLQLFGVLEVM
jgi:hypothetical protein